MLLVTKYNLFHIQTIQNNTKIPILCITGKLDQHEHFKITDFFLNEFSKFRKTDKSPRQELGSV